MADLYANYAALAAAKVEGVDYTRTAIVRNGSIWSSIAIHGGGIEAGSGEMATAVADKLMSSYVFAGIMASGNTDLHITSTNFDEPIGVALVAQSRKTLSFHGFAGTAGVKETAIGGRDTATIALLTARLTAAGFTVITTPSEIGGDDPANICNENLSKAGVQIEMSLAQRQAFFPGGDTSRTMRESGQRTAEFWTYVSVMRTVGYLDDALNTSAPVWTAPELSVDWQEQFPNLFFSGNPDRINDLSQQMTGAFTVEHSIDDGLPDAVTMTTSADASGKAEIPLNGRQGIEAVSIGWRSAVTEGATATDNIFFFSLPGDVQYGDYLICGVAINSGTVTVSNYADDTESYEQWKLLSQVTDAAVTLFVFGKRSWGDAEGGFTCDFSAPVNYSAVMVAAYARAMDPNIWVDFAPGLVVSGTETSGVAVTAHTAPEVQLRRRGFGVTVWACNSTIGPLVYTGSGAALGNSTTALHAMIASGPLSQPGDYTYTANTTTGTTTVPMVSIPLEVADRPTMDARQFFSPFNKTSPVYGWDRDTADTELVFNVLTANGPEGTTIHKGQMADISIEGRQAKMQAISRTRLLLDKSLTLPVVFGNRENCSIDWLVTWAMARGAQWIGPAPGALTRYWAPMYGSTHAHMTSEYGYNGAIAWDANGGPYGVKPPSVVDGPFLTAMYAQQTATRTEEIFLDAKRLDLITEGLPTSFNFGYDNPQLNYDQFSAASSQGRISFWLRGDAVTAAPSYLASTDDLIFRYNLYCQDSAGGFLGYVIIRVFSDTRYINVWMGSDIGGSGNVTFVSQGALPTDGAWHFISVSWDYAGGRCKVKMDGNTESTNTYWATNGYNVTGQLPSTDAAHLKANGSFRNYIRSHVPISDLQIESGSPAYGNPFNRLYPPDRAVNPSYEGGNAIMRATYQTIEAVAESSPVNGWELLTQLAQASMSSYRVDEQDNFRFLPLSYFGEAAQLVSTVVADTEVNAGELDVKTDPSKARNVVTVKFDETRVATWYGPILTITSSVEIPRGTSVLTFALDVPAVEIHRQSDPFGTDWTLTNLTAAQIAAPTTIPTDKHYFSVNTAQDGTGTIASSLSVTAKILSATASTITIQFTNKMSKTGYLANNGDQVPFLRILGYGVTTADGYITQRDAGSIGSRRERSLDTEVSWVQDRTSATILAQLMVTALARPRPEVNVTVMGDPRRMPGQLVTLKDSQGTQAAGTWRILSVKHNADGPQYTQDLQLTFVPPVGVWDQGNWDETIWSE